MVRFGNNRYSIAEFVERTAWCGKYVHDELSLSGMDVSRFNPDPSNRHRNISQTREE